ncbi:MAG: family 10 glycosylhydrolase [Chthonomonadales bacterium]|nr:family 10 glycosylhydrolase [Chthonomonadales bacterium]
MGIWPMVLVSLTVGLAWAADRLVIEDAPYRDSATASAAWVPAYGSSPAQLASEKTPDGRVALRFDCNMAALSERACWDRAVNLDLSRHSRILFWVKLVGDASAIGHCTLYFNAGSGWYGQSFDVPEEGWQRVALDRGGFTPEDSPQGWARIQGIRVSFWKGRDRTATVLLGGMEAEAASVAVVRNARAGDEGSLWADRMASMLREAGVDAGTVDDVDVEQGVLQGKRIAVLPNNGRISDAEADALDEFVARGGRILACYGLPDRLASLLGLADVQWMQQARAGQFAAMRFKPGGPVGIPKVVKQASWNVTRVQAAARNARVIAEWEDSGGKATGIPAVVLSDTGAFVSHVILDDDRPAKLQMLRALLGHFDADLWPALAEKALQNAGAVGSRWKSFDEAEAGIRAAARASRKLEAVDRRLAAAERNRGRAAAAIKARRFHDALEPAAAARRDLTEAFALAQSPRAGEFRAVWCHSAYGVDGMTWDEAIANLKRNGFTAVVPNMLWGGSADYASEVLPVTERARTEGDQIEACLKACRKHGIEVHVWKVNWNLSTAPDGFVARMRDEGRLQRSSDGTEERWLCPSHPANFELERDSMLEVARKYGVDGIHFDYIRYPDSSKCYCDGCRQRFEALQMLGSDRPFPGLRDWPRDVLRGGPLHAEYQEFRRQNITRLVKAVAEEARKIRPGIKISAAVFPNWPACRDEIGQDWGAWVRDGYLNFVCPMDYTASNREFRTRVQVQRDEVQRRIPLIPGIGASAPGLDAVQTIEQAIIARSEGAQGFIIFNYDSRTAGEHIPLMGKGLAAAR